MLRVEYRDGLYLPDLDLWLDAAGPREHSVVSHAHADHIAAHRRIVATPETARLFAHRLGACEVEALGYGERRDYGRYALTLLPAGHCLGSAQTLVEADGERLVYTGDIKLRPNVAAEQAVIVPCDTLVMEVTFGDPAFRFPPEGEVIDRLCEVIDRALAEERTPVVFAYALGKSQEALEHLLRRGYRIALYGSVWTTTEVYRELGVQFSGEYERYAGGSLEGRVLMAAPGCRSYPPVAELKRKTTVMLTGWAVKGGQRFYADVDVLLPLSDHADYDELVRLVVETRAERVITMHGGASFAADLRQMGLNAEHLAVYPNVSAGRVKVGRAATSVQRKLFE